MCVFLSPSSVIPKEGVGTPLKILHMPVTELYFKCEFYDLVLAYKGSYMKDKNEKSNSQLHLEISTENEPDYTCPPYM